MMDNSEAVQLTLEVSASDAADDDIDRMTRQLLSELKTTDVESAQLVSGGSAPLGAKGDPVTIGSIALVVLPAVLPKIADMVQAWVLRGSGRTVKFKGRIAGQAVEFEGSAADLQKLIERLEQGRKSEHKVRPDNR